MSNNETLFARAQLTTPGGVNSPVRAFRSVGGTPRFIRRAAGPYFWDADERRYTPVDGEGAVVTRVYVTLPPRSSVDFPEPSDDVEIEAIAPPLEAADAPPPETARMRVVSVERAPDGRTRLLVRYRTSSASTDVKQAGTYIDHVLASLKAHV